METWNGYKKSWFKDQIQNSMKDKYSINWLGLLQQRKHAHSKDMLGSPDTIYLKYLTKEEPYNIHQSSRVMFVLFNFMTQTLHGVQLMGLGPLGVPFLLFSLKKP